MNKLYFGDNLHILRDHIPGDSDDLIYLHPPFNSKQCLSLLITCLYILLLFNGCTMYVTEDSLFHPSRATISSRDSVGTGMTRKNNMELEVGPNIVLRGYRISHPNTKVRLIYFAGNGSTVAVARKLLDSLSICFNAEVFSFDWRGYGFSDGSPSLREIMDDAVKIFDFASDASASSPIVIGRSLGSGIASYVSSIRKPSALVLISPPADLNSVIAGWSHFSPWYLRPFIRVRPDSTLQNLHPQPIELASLITCPVLIIHGDKDELIPITSGRELFDGLINSKNKKFVVLGGQNHYTINIVSTPVSDSVSNFLSAIIK